MGHRSFYAHSKRNSDTKEWQKLSLHLSSVAEHTSSLAEKIGLAHAGELIGLAHDLGKYSQAFQQYLKKVANDAAMEMESDFSLKGSVDHSTAGAQIIEAGLASGNGGIASQNPRSQGVSGAQFTDVSSLAGKCSTRVLSSLTAAASAPASISKRK